MPRVDKRLLQPDQAQTARNCWLTSGTIRPIPALIDLALPTGGQNDTLYRFSPTQWFAWNIDVDVAPYPAVEDTTRRTVWTGEDFPRMTSLTIMGAFSGVGTPVSRRLGIPAPTDPPMVSVRMLAVDAVDDQVPTEFHSYVYTYLSDLGEEGPPSPPSSTIERAYSTDGAIQTVDVSNLSTGVTGPYGITKKRIYRTITGTSGETTFQLLAEIRVTSPSYVDSKLGSELGTDLLSASWDPPPDDLTGLIALNNGILAGFVGKDVYFCEPYQPHAWPKDYIQAMDADVVGLTSFGTTVVALTKGDPGLISGSHPATMTSADLEINQSCVSKRSIARLGEVGAVYASPDGLVLVGPGVGKIISKEAFSLREWRDLGPENMMAFYHDDHYVAFLGDRAVSYTETGGLVEFDDDDVTAGYVDRENDQLFVIDSGRIKEWSTIAPDGYTGSYRQARWRSKVHVGSPRIYTAAQVKAKTYPVALKVYGDGNILATVTVSNRDPFRIPNVLKYYGDWEYEVEGTVEVEEVRIGTMTDMDG